MPRECYQDGLPVHMDAPADSCRGRRAGLASPRDRSCERSTTNVHAMAPAYKNTGPGCRRPGIALTGLLLALYSVGLHDVRGNGLAESTAWRALRCKPGANIRETFGCFCSSAPHFLRGGDCGLSCPDSDDHVEGDTISRISMHGDACECKKSGCSDHGYKYPFAPCHLRLRGGASAAMEDAVEHVSGYEEEHAWKAKRADSQPGNSCSMMGAQKTRSDKDSTTDQAWMTKVIADMLSASTTYAKDNSNKNVMRKACSMNSQANIHVHSLAKAHDDSFLTDVSLVSASADTSCDQLHGGDSQVVAHPRTRRLSRAATMPDKMPSVAAVYESWERADDKLNDVHDQGHMEAAVHDAHTIHNGHDHDNNSHDNRPKMREPQGTMDASALHGVMETCTRTHDVTATPACANSKSDLVVSQDSLEGPICKQQQQKQVHACVINSADYNGKHLTEPVPPQASDTQKQSPSSSSSSSTRSTSRHKGPRAKSSKRRANPPRISASEKLWGSDGTIEAVICMICSKDIGGGHEWFMAYDKRHCSVTCAQVSARMFDEQHPPVHEAEPTAVYLCTQT
jgi:hypothetical protein